MSDMSDMSNKHDAIDAKPPAVPMPTAVALPPRRRSLVWLVPLAALLVAGYALWHAWSERGVVVTISFEEGHGIVPGDPVKHRGIAIGTVRAVALAPEAKGVIVTLSLRREADVLAAVGSRFWLVRPEIGFQRISGLDTIVGARYVAVLPAESAHGETQPGQTSFVGLEAPPVVGRRQRGDLTIIVEAPRRGSLAAGSPVIYRQVPIGVVERVGLASDAGSVECEVLIEAPYAALVREGTRFWDAGGIEVGVGLKGVTATVESPEIVLRGGLALATPPDATTPAVDGARFRLEDRVDEAWLRWKPQVVIGSALLPPGMPEPDMAVVAMNWSAGALFARDRSRVGWGLATQRGFVVPAWTVAPPEGAYADSVALAVNGGAIPWPPAVIADEGGVALIDLAAGDIGALAWPTARMRVPTVPEDCVVIAGLSRSLALAPGRLRADGDGWVIDPGLPIDDSLDGGAVVARADGAVIGLLERRKGDRWRVRPLPASVVGP